MRFVTVLAVLALFIGAGCRGANRGSEAARVATDVAANIDDYHIESIAILGYSNTTGVKEANEMADFVTAALLQSGKYRFDIAEDFERHLNVLDMGDDHARIMSTWLKKQKVDEAVIQRVLKATGHDAILAMEITKWQEVKLQATQEGTSDTSVGIRLNLYAADGTLLWKASDLKTAHSVEYLPAFNIKATQSGQARTTSEHAVPDPPPIKKVAIEVAQNIVAQMPDIKRKDPED